MDYQKVVFSGHAVKQMFQRKISRDEVKAVLDYGEVIAEYPEDRPYPSYLMLNMVSQRPIHAVVAKDAETQTIYVVTVYEPDVELWQADFKTRKKV
ncbi:DUF4258 domain-containing protein [Leptolyngbya subtilissima]|uniref:DUF4258 domain-containing protein n=1 Tax=Leptolyngbya subtilissima DQ-A4 TaxID=2933933 RepID=A0ABV0KB98_9CYAN|nr:DUF4258 domain-containing protein [Nodosilinea sp. FACHB-141]